MTSVLGSIDPTTPHPFEGGETDMDLCRWCKRHRTDVLHDKPTLADAIREGLEPPAQDPAAKPLEEQPPPPEPPTDQQVHDAVRALTQAMLNTGGRYYSTRSAQSNVIEARCYVNILGCQLDAIVGLFIKKGLFTAREFSEAMAQQLAAGEQQLRRVVLADPGTGVNRGRPA